MIEPLPCPFCGGDAELQTDKGPTGELYGWVGCNQCDAMSGHCDLRSMQPEELHPIAAWNIRARPVISDAMVEAGTMAIADYDTGLPVRDHSALSRAVLTAALGGPSDD